MPPRPDSGGAAPADLRVAPWIRLGSYAVMAGLIAWQMLQTPGYLVDDAFVYLRYAQNVGEGRGWAFNPGEQYNIATSPGFLLLHVLQATLLGTEHLYEIARIDSFLFTLALAIGVERLLARLDPWLGIAAGLTVVLTPHFAKMVGMESMLELALICAALLAYRDRRWHRLTAVLSVLPLLRMEDSLLVVLFVVAMWVRDRLPLRFLAVRSAITTLPLLGWLVFARVMFGRMLPDTLGAKVFQARSGIWPEATMFDNLLAPYLVHDGLPWTWLCAVDVDWSQPTVWGALSGHLLALVLVTASLGLVVIGAVASLRSANARGFGVLFGWALIHAALYGVILDVPGYGWYFSLEVLAFVVLLYVGIDRVGARWRPVKYGIAAALVVGFGVQFALRPAVVDSRTGPYGELATWIRANTAPDAVIVFDEPGQIAFLCDRTIADRFGLASAKYLARLDRGQKEMFWWGDLQTDRPVYFVSGRGQRPFPLVARQFDAMLVHASDDPLQMRVYRLEPERFLLPGSDEFSLFDTEYRVAGTPPVITLVPVTDRITAALLLRPLEPGASEILEVAFDPPVSDASAFGMLATLPLAGRAAPPPLGLEVVYADGETAAAAPIAGDTGSWFALRDQPIVAIRVIPPADLAASTVLALAHPVFRR